MEHLNVQKFRDRTASYYRLMNVDKAACRGHEKEAFANRVSKNFDEAMTVKCTKNDFKFDRKTTSNSTGGLVIASKTD